MEGSEKDKYILPASFNSFISKLMIYRALKYMILECKLQQNVSVFKYYIWTYLQCIEKQVVHRSIPRDNLQYVLTC